MEIQKVTTKPFNDQRPGTSGLRKPTKRFQEPHYLENFIQSIFNVLKEDSTLDFSKEILVLGGDGRYYNKEAIQIILRIAAANGIGKVLVGQNGILSTPAVSALIRKHRAVGGIILSASHNPGGPDGDFGVKYNIGNGGPAPSEFTEACFKKAESIREYYIFESQPLDLAQISTCQIGATAVDVIDSVDNYVQLMRELFDFESIKNWFRSGHKILFDAMHAVTGPYAKEIFENQLGAQPGSVINCKPLEDFGQGHPDPNLVYAKDLVGFMFAENAADLGAASDGDGDRNMILGNSFFVSPGDSLALIAEYLHTVAPGYKNGLKGVARSMPTSKAVDRVAQKLQIPCFETPTGWKYFGSLMDAGLCTLCGEESFGTGSDHIREKDGIWAVLCWLSILAKTNTSVEEIMHKHWQTYGRSFFQRYDFEGLDLARATEMFKAFRGGLENLKGRNFCGLKIKNADEFSYTDPVKHTTANRQGIRLLLEDEARVIVRFSGTGTHGATLRIYLEYFDRENYDRDADRVLKVFADEIISMLKLEEYCQTRQPTVVT